MCGITGFIDTSKKHGNGELRNIVAAMADTLRHRGPDDSGVWVDDHAGIALGHRRLSILDLSPEGHQPMLVTPVVRLVLFLCYCNIISIRQMVHIPDYFRQAFRFNSDTNPEQSEHSR